MPPFNEPLKCSLHNLHVSINGCMCVYVCCLFICLACVCRLFKAFWWRVCHHTGTCVCCNNFFTIFCFHSFYGKYFSLWVNCRYPAVILAWAHLRRSLTRNKSVDCFDVFHFAVVGWCRIAYFANRYPAGGDAHKNANARLALGTSTARQRKR